MFVFYLDFLGLPSQLFYCEFIFEMVSNSNEGLVNQYRIRTQKGYVSKETTQIKRINKRGVSNAKSQNDLAILWVDIWVEQLLLLDSIIQQQNSRNRSVQRSDFFNQSIQKAYLFSQGMKTQIQEPKRPNSIRLISRKPSAQTPKPLALKENNLGVSLYPDNGFTFEGIQPKFSKASFHKGAQIPKPESSRVLKQKENQYSFESFESDEESFPRTLIGQSQMNCSVCNEKIWSREIISLEDCKHSLHLSCLLPHLQQKIRQGKIPIGCPFVDCPTLVSEGFLRKVLPKDDLNAYYKFSAYSFAEARLIRKQWFPCPTPNCREVISKPSPNHKLIYCRKQNKKYCALCLDDFHPAFKDCQQYRQSRDPKFNDKKLLEVVQEKGWKQCPNCKLYVQKNQGCNHIACRCGHHFCYACSGPHPNCHCTRQPGYNQIPPELLERARH